MKVCGSDKGRKGYKQRDRGLPTVADGELMLEGWSIVSSKEGRGERGKEQVSALQPLLLLPLLLGAKFRKEEGREGLCACGGIFATWAPRFPKLPPPPLLLRHLILFPATQLYAKSGQEALGSRNNLTQK